MYLARGDVHNYKRAILTYSRHTPGTAHWIDPVVRGLSIENDWSAHAQANDPRLLQMNNTQIQPVPVKKATGGRRGGGSSAAQGGSAWDLRCVARP